MKTAFLACMLVVASTSLFQAEAQDRKQIIHVTSRVHEVLPSDSGSVFDNVGARANVTFSLCECTPETEGVFWTFVVEQERHEVFIQPHVNNSIRGVGGKGQKIKADKVPGAFMTLLCKHNSADRYDYQPMGFLGHWINGR
jgi:hypothetical protein